MLEKVNAAIITIGDELMIGQITDTNSSYIAKELTKIGFTINYKRSIPDDKDAIIQTLNDAFLVSNLIVLTGGLGPTKDDITKRVLCDYFGTELVFNQDVFDDILEVLAHRPNAMNGLNRTQAFVPKDSIIIRNKVGTAPIMWFQKDNNILVSLPGVPNEMKWVMENVLLEKLKHSFRLPNIIHQHVVVYGYAESVLAETISEWENQLPNNMSLAYLPTVSYVRLRLSVTGESKDESQSSIDSQLDGLKQVLGSAIVAIDDQPLEKIFANWVTDMNISVATAESCTGGNIARLITSIPGSSVYFKGSIIAYDNQVKEDLLAVPNHVIKTNGAVSREVVEQMACGALKQLKADIALATSGIAGPDGGTLEKPVGTVWVAACNNKKVISKCFSFGNIRERVIERASYAAMILAKELMEDMSPKL